MKKTILLAVGLAVLLTGCAGQELSNVSLVRVLGIDGGGPVIVTAVAGAEDERGIFRCAGEDVPAAQKTLETLGSERLAVTHIGQVVLGENAAAQCLWDEVVQRESGYGATVWLAETGTAYDLLTGASDPAGRLKHLEESGVAAPTLLEAVSALVRCGEVTVPVLGLRDGGLEVVGWRALKGEF